MYSRYNSNFKFIGSAIKYIGFDSIHYVINLDIVSSFTVFSDGNSMFLSMYC